MLRNPILDRYFPAMFSQDREALGALFSDDVVWHVPPFVAETVAESTGAPPGRVEGREAVIAFLTGASDQYYRPGSFSLEVELEVGEADRAAVIGRIRATTAAGVPYENRYSFGFRLREGQICEVWELLDSLHFQAQQAAKPD